MFDYSPLVLFFFFKVEISSRTSIPPCYAKISPQWLGEMRRLWPNVPRRVACKLFPDRKLGHYTWTAA